MYGNSVLRMLANAIGQGLSGLGLIGNKMVLTETGKNPCTTAIRSRVPGKARPAGSKLARQVGTFTCRAPTGTHHRQFN